MKQSLALVAALLLLAVPTVGRAAPVALNLSGQLSHNVPGMTPSSTFPPIADLVSGTFTFGFSEIDGIEPFTGWDILVASAQITTPVADPSTAHLWIGLKNGDDQGTRFDLLVELLRNGSPVASGLTRCIGGVTRNPTRAKEVAVAFDAGAVSTAPGDVLALRVSTRIGTKPNDTKCAGHSSARGLRLYYDSVDRSSRVGFTVGPDGSQDLFLGSDGGPCRDTESADVTAETLSPTAPTATTAKCADSGSVTFAGGNPFNEIGTWILP